MINAYPEWQFYTCIEHYPGEKLALKLKAAWPAYQRWFRSVAIEQRTTAAQGRHQLQTFMPELLATYDKLCVAFVADEEVAAFLSLYNPPSFRAACSQAAWTRESISLFRNYDFPGALCDRQLLYTNWNGTRVIGMSDCLWGLLDGMNEHGLAVSLAYGGRNKRQQGFAITLVLRYILETCSTVVQGIAVLQRVPVNMPYNVTLLDRSGSTTTIELCPGLPPKNSSLKFATNHQLGGAMENMDAVADSCLRERFLSIRMADPLQTVAGMREMFLNPPLLRRQSDWHGWGTMYTAHYSLSDGVVTLAWPNGQTLQSSFDHFSDRSIVVASPAYQ
jgi:predicted choloylglycine hydrolase